VTMNKFLLCAVLGLALAPTAFSAKDQDCTSIKKSRKCRGSCEWRFKAVKSGVDGLSKFKSCQVKIAPTPPPTAAPTASPTAAPPTVSPTAAPTGPPTPVVPTASPTPAPTGTPGPLPKVYASGFEWVVDDATLTSEFGETTDTFGLEHKMGCCDSSGDMDTGFQPKVFVPEDKNVKGKKVMYIAAADAFDFDSFNVNFTWNASTHPKDCIESCHPTDVNGTACVAVELQAHVWRQQVLAYTCNRHLIDTAETSVAEYFKQREGLIASQTRTKNKKCRNRTQCNRWSKACPDCPTWPPTAAPTAAPTPPPTSKGQRPIATPPPRSCRQPQCKKYLRKVKRGKKELEDVCKLKNCRGCGDCINESCSGLGFVNNTEFQQTSCAAGNTVKSTLPSSACAAASCTSKECCDKDKK